MQPVRNRTNKLAMILAIVIAVVFVAFFGVNTVRNQLTPEEKIELARQRFGLVFPNEILFLPNDE